MAMTFTLSTHLREQLSALIHSRIERRKQEEAEKERKALEVRLYWPTDTADTYTIHCRRRKHEHEELR